MREHFFILGAMLLVLTGTSCGSDDAALETQSLPPAPVVEKRVPDPVAVLVAEPIVSPGVQRFEVTAKQWAFEPSTIRVKQGEHVVLRVTSTDVEHGFTLDAYGIEETLEPFKPVTIEFIASKKGTFTFFCHVYCGSGHGNMKGTLIVE